VGHLAFEGHGGETHSGPRSQALAVSQRTAVDFNATWSVDRSVQLSIWKRRYTISPTRAVNAPNQSHGRPGGPRYNEAIIVTQLAARGFARSVAFLACIE
jgi:hypothetical protein